MALERFFLQKFENCDFITKRKAQVFFYYSLFLLILLGLLLVLYTVMPISSELARKGYLGAAAIIFLVIMSLFFLRTGKLETAVWSYAVPTILVIIALRLINARPAPETAFTTYIFYMLYMIVYVAVFGKNGMYFLLPFFLPRQTGLYGRLLRMQVLFLMQHLLPELLTAPWVF